MLRRDRECIHREVVWRVWEAGGKEREEKGRGRKMIQIV
jgi:hypothetical protein